MALKLIRFLNRETRGSKFRIVSASLVSGVSRGLLLATFNSAAAIGVSQGPGLGVLVAAFLAALLTYLVSTYDATRQGTRMVESMFERLRLRLCVKLLHSPLRFLEARGTGDIYTQLSQDINRLSGASMTVLNAFQAVVLVCFALLYLAWLSPWSFLAAAATIFAGAATYVWQDKEAKRNLESARALQGEFFNRINDLLHGFKELKLSRSKQASFVNHLTDIASEYRDRNVRADTMFAVSFLTSQSFTFLLIAVLVFVLPVVAPAERATTFQFLATILFIIGPVETAVGAIPTLARARVALESLEGLEAGLDEELAHSREQDGISTPAHFQTIEFRDVRFHFTGSANETFGVGPIDFVLKRNEIVFIVGGNGAGKTTFMKLLSGLYQPESGSIYVDGREVQTGEHQTYREMFSAVFGDFHLFKRLYGLEPVEPARFRTLLKELRIQDKTSIADGELTTIHLSAGQRKRLAYAVSRLAERQIYLFDEFAADQDPAFRGYFYGELLPRLREQGKTIVAVTHDDKWFGVADRVIRMDYGRIGEVARAGRATVP